MNYRKWRNVAFGIRIAGVVFLLIGILWSRTLYGFVLALIGLLVVLISFLVSILKNRCPECGRFLYENERSFRAPDFCPYCGGDLRDKSNGEGE